MIDVEASPETLLDLLRVLRGTSPRARAAGLKELHFKISPYTQIMPEKLYKIAAVLAFILARRAHNGDPLEDLVVSECLKWGPMFGFPDVQWITKNVKLQECQCSSHQLDFISDGDDSDYLYDDEFVHG